MLGEEPHAAILGAMRKKTDSAERCENLLPGSWNHIEGEQKAPKRGQVPDSVLGQFQTGFLGQNWCRSPAWRRPANYWRRRA